MSEALPHRRALAGRAARQGGALALRHVIVQGVNFACGILLLRLLGTADFGQYGVLVFLVSLLSVLSDPGLAASLVREGREPSIAELRSTLLIQQGAAVVWIALFWFLAPWIALKYGLSADQAGYFRLGSLAVLLLPLQQICTIRLERGLDFRRIAFVEVLQCVAFNGTSLYFAWSGSGAMSLAYGVGARALVGAITTFLLSPWRVGLSLPDAGFREHFRFGLPYQGNALLGVIYGAVNAVLVGSFFGLESVGVVLWAGSLLGYLHQPLFLFNRLLFPGFARLRDDRAGLGMALNHTYLLAAFYFFGAACLLGGFAEPLTLALYKEKWLVGVPILELMILGSLFVPLAIPNGALANALGWSGRVLMITLVRVIVLWGAAWVLSRTMRTVEAYGYAFIAAEALHLWLYVLICRDLPGRRGLRSLLPFALAGGIVVTVGRVLGAGGITDIGILVGMIVAAGSAYLVLALLLSRLSGSSVLGLLRILWQRGWRDA